MVWRGTLVNRLIYTLTCVQRDCWGVGTTKKAINYLENHNIHKLYNSLDINVSYAFPTSVASFPQRKVQQERRKSKRRWRAEHLKRRRESETPKCRGSKWTTTGNMHQHKITTATTPCTINKYIYVYAVCIKNPTFCLLTFKSKLRPAICDACILSLCWEKVTMMMIMSIQRIKNSTAAGVFYCNFYIMKWWQWWWLCSWWWWCTYVGSMSDLHC